MATTRTHQYLALIHKDPGSDFGVSFPDFPGCVSVGSTLEEAERMAAEALALHVEFLLEGGGVLPESCSTEEAYETARELPAEAGPAVIVPITLKLPAPAKRINITMDPHLLAEVDQAAKERGMGRSAFLAEGARRLLGVG